MDGSTLSKAMGGNISQARYNQLAPAFTLALKQAGCTTTLRAAMFAAQIGHESMGLRYMEEIASGSAYEGRKDLGNTQKGDGVRFKGRGPIQITGRHNYTEVSKWAFSKGYVPNASYFVNNPAQLATDKYAFLGAVWYWTVARNMNSYADKKDINGATRAINGALNGLSDRTTRYNRCLGIGNALIAGVASAAAATNAATGPTADGVVLGSYKTSGTKIKFRTLYHNNNVAANSTCFCVTQAVAVAEARLKAKGVIIECLDFWQFGYGQAAAASADTHAAGGVIDTVQIDDVTLKVLREVGFTAAWYRGPGAAHGNFSTKHIHAVLSGCPHVSGGAASQVTQVRNGQNGLANHAKDDGPKVAYITWQDAWKKYVKEPTKASTTKPAAKPAAPKPAVKKEGVPVMAKPTKRSRNKATSFGPSSAWKFIPVNEAGTEWSLASGPGTIYATVDLHVDVPTRVRFVTVNKNGKKVAYSTKYGDIHLVAGGNQVVFFDTIGGPAKGYKGKYVRLEILTGTAKKTVVSKMRIRAAKEK